MEITQIEAFIFANCTIFYVVKFDNGIFFLFFFLSLFHWSVIYKQVA